MLFRSSGTITFDGAPLPNEGSSPDVYLDFTETSNGLTYTVGVDGPDYGIVVPDGVYDVRIRDYHGRSFTDTWPGGECIEIGP